MRKSALLMSAILAASASVSEAANVLVNADQQGYVLLNENPTSIGLVSGAGQTASYSFAGNFLNFRYNTWTSFTIPVLSGTVTQVTLSGGLVPDGVTSDQTIGIFDVSTPLSTLATYSENLAVATSAHVDLGTGGQYGTLVGFNGPYSITLGGSILSGIQAASGGTFILGYSNDTQNALAFTNTGGVHLFNAMPTLSITTAVPEPQNYAMLVVGLALVGWITRQKRTTRA